MTSSNKSFNPLHALLVVASVFFALTACAYGVMAIHRIDPTGSIEAASDDALLSDASEASGRVFPAAESSGLPDSPDNAETPPHSAAKETVRRSAHGQWLLEQLDRHGATLLMIELAVIAATAVAVVATDRGNPK
jgi:cytochrome b